MVAPLPYFPKFVPSKMYGRFALVAGEAVLNGLAVSYPRVPVIPKVGRSLYGLLYAAALLRPMTKAIRRTRPDALLSYWAYPDGFATVLLARCFGLPVFVAGMGCDVNDPDRHFGTRRIVTWTFQDATGAFAVSRALGERIVALGVDAAKVKVVPNGLDDAYLANGASGSSADGEKRPGTTVLFCGRLSEEKDPLYLLEAARLLLARRPAARLQFVGDGPLRKKLEELAEEWHIKDRVSFVGEIRHDRVAGYMRQADVLCLTSLREGYPNVLLEALAVHDAARPAELGDAHAIDEVLRRNEETLNRLTSVIKAVQVQRPQRLKKQLEGDRLDLDACIDATVDLRTGRAPDPRVMSGRAS